jgi:hypothetical protein
MSYIISQKEVITRKEQKCFGCMRKFPSRTKMLRSCVKDGDVFTMYLCPTCQYIYSRELESGDEFCKGDLYERAVEVEAERSKG